MGGKIKKNKRKYKKDKYRVIIINRDKIKEYIISKARILMFERIILLFTLVLIALIITMLLLSIKYKEYKSFFKNNSDVLELRERIAKEDKEKENELKNIQNVTLSNINTLPMEKKNLLMEIIPSSYPFKEPHTITSKFGMREHPIDNQEKEHKGIDMRANIGDEVISPAIGTVIFAGQQSGYGNVVIIEHMFGFQTLYGHLNEINVSVGEKVGKGKVIAKAGNTGRSTGPHLHYEVKYEGVQINPENFVKWNEKNFDIIFKNERSIKWEYFLTIVGKN